MAKKESTELQTTTGTDVAIQNIPTLDEWGIPEISAKDTIISKVFPMQMMSKKVSDGVASFGEFRDSVTNELLGGVTKPLEFIPIKIDKVWVESEYDGKDWKYKRTVPVTAENDDAKYEETVGQVKVKRVRTYNALILLPQDIESAVPKIISFRSSSMRAGQKLMTQIYVVNRQAKLAPAAKVMRLTGAKQKNDRGTFLVLDVDVARDATPLEQVKALEWFKLMKASPETVKVDTSEDLDPAPIPDAVQDF